MRYFNEYVFHTGDPGHSTSVRIPQDYIEELFGLMKVHFVAEGGLFDHEWLFALFDDSVVHLHVTKHSGYLLTYENALWELARFGKPIYYAPLLPAGPPV